MAPDDNSGARPAGPVVLRIKLRYDDVDAMVQRFAPNIGKSGVFLPTRSVQPVGTEVKFELRLANDTPVLVGMGRVKHVREPDPENPRAAFGIGIELTRVTREGRDVIMKMLTRRREMGLPDVAIPAPEDLESARRAEVETQPRAEAIPREAVPQVPSAPLLTSARPGSGPIAVGRHEGSGRVAVPILAPEKVRARRPRVEELIDRAAEMSARIVVAPVEELDMHVDLDRVLSRARALAGGDMDIELSTLRDAAAAPNEISVEAASAELARQLGGKPIGKREKSARWQPPPPVELKSPIREASEFATKVRAETEAAPAAAIAAVVDTAVEHAAEAALPPADAEPELELRTPPDASPSLVPQESYVIRQSSQLVAQTDAENYDDAFAQNASTTTAIDPAVREPKSFPEIGTDPSVPNEMMIDDDADVSSFERALDAARIHTGVSAPAPEIPGDQGLDDPADSTMIGEPIADVGYDEEVDDLDVLAEADEEDEDLMRAHGEAEVSAGHAAPADAYSPYETPPPAEDDFHARLDLGDDDDGPPPPPSDDIDRNDAREFDAHVPYERARRASSEGSYTYAEPHVPQSVPQFTPHATGEEFDEPHHFPAQQPATPTAPPGPDPRVLQHGRPTTTRSEDLEDALAALDAGNIDLERQRSRTRRPTPATQRPPLSESSAPRALPGLPMEASGPRSLPKGESSAPRPLPGLPVERPRTGPVPIVQPQQSQRLAHTVQRPPTGAQPVAQPPRPKSPTGQVSTAKPPPIPAAARRPTGAVPITKPATQPAPVVKRPPTDEGVLIDFDDDE